MRSRFGALTQADLRRLWIGQTISAAGDALTGVALGNLAVGPLAAGFGTQAALIMLALVAGVPLAIVAFVPSIRAIRAQASTEEHALDEGAGSKPVLQTGAPSL